MKIEHSSKSSYLRCINGVILRRIGVLCLVAIGLLFSGVAAVQAIDHAAPLTAEALPVTPPGEQRTSVMVELDAPPVAAIYAANQASGDVSAASMAAITQTYLRTVEAAQAQLADQLTAAGAVEIFRVQRVYNGVAVRASDSQIKAIATLPGVKAVHPLIPKLPTNARSVPYIGAPSLWAGAGMGGVKLAGEGMRIAVIDTGIDYLHTDFGGPGAGYDVNDPTIIGDAPNFPGIKVSGGYDFAGEDYNADPDDASYQPVPHPDPDPVDCYAHGTHVAGTAAGYGVDWSGDPYDGPYDSLLDFSQFQIGPGVAPLAEIYALKIFGCTGSTDLTDLAIEWAVDPNGDGDFSDHVDVINMSIGSPFGSVYDTSAVASDSAAQIGVIVVASAGNTGDVYFAVGSPAVADRVISVAAVSLPDPTPGTEALITSFSARGPRTSDSALKPDIAAPGRSIASAWSGTGDKGVRFSGTSMAAPHIAGAAALLRQGRPEWSVEEIKALLMNSASFPAGPASADVPYGPTRTGAGVIDLRAAITTTLLAYNADVPGAVSLSFGAPEVLDRTTLTRTLRLVNKSMTTTVVSLAYEALNDLPGATVELAITSPITIAAGGWVDAPVCMNVVATELQHVRDPATSEVQILPRHWLAEETGFVIVTPVDANHGLTQTLRVPLHAAPRPAAELRADGPLDIDSEMAGAIMLTGTGIDGENPPVGVISMVSAFELAYSRPNTPGPAAIEVVEVIDPLAYGDLRHVGVTSDYPQSKSLDETMLYFGIATVKPWSSPNRLRVNIYIDANGDGQDDYLLFNSSEAGFTNDNRFSDAFVTVVENLETGEFSRRQLLNVLSALAFDTGVYNNSVMVLPVRAVDIGLAGETGQFRYRVETEVAEEEDIRDQTPMLVYDARRPGLDLFTDNLDAPLIKAEDGVMIGARLDVVNYAANRSGGMLLLHHHNRTGDHAEATPLRLDLPEKFYLPVAMGE